METESLLVYLNDHLAGSVTAVELLDALIHREPDTQLGLFLTDLRADVIVDQGTLKEAIHRLGGEESAVKKAAAWLTEKLTRLKLAAGGSGEGELALFEALEALGLGILGKRAMWRALRALGDGFATAAGLDLERLERRADEQYGRLEERRLRTARPALLGP